MNSTEIHRTEITQPASKQRVIYKIAPINAAVPKQPQTVRIISGVNIKTTNTLMGTLKDLSTRLDGIDQKIDTMFMEQIRAKVIIKEISKTLDNVLEKDPVNLKLPIQTLEELEECEYKIANQPIFKTKLLAILKDKTLDYMFKLIHIDVLFHYNAKGTKGKRCFLKLGLSNVMNEACTVNEGLRYKKLVSKYVRKAHNRYYLVTYRDRQKSNETTTKFEEKPEANDDTEYGTQEEYVY